MFRFSQRSLKALEGVHPRLVAVVHRALELSPVDFTVVEGLRTKEKQLENFAKGVSLTLDSKHLKQPDGYGHAVDLYPYYDGRVQVRAPWNSFLAISRVMKQAAEECKVKLTWGGDWKKLKDGPHYQLELNV